MAEILTGKVGQLFKPLIHLYKYLSIMTTQSTLLLNEWNATAKEMLNAEFALQSQRCRQVAERFDGVCYSRIHRAHNGDLMLEERFKGDMYPSCWLIEQDFSELEALLNTRPVS